MMDFINFCDTNYFA